MENKEEIIGVIASVLEVEPSTLNMEDTVGSVATWDSIHQLMIVSALEETFNIHYPEENLFEMNSVKAIVNQTIALF